MAEEAGIDPRQAKPATAFKAASSSMPDFFQFGGVSEIRTRDGVNQHGGTARTFPDKLPVYPANRSKWYARRVMLPVQALI
jgi:hypothetical protein